MLLDAFQRLARRSPDYRLLTIGDGPMRPEIERFAKQHRLCDRVEMAGAVDKPRVVELLRQVDVATAPYHDQAGFYFSPLKLFEYMAAGLPIVSSAMGQISETLRDGETGILTKPGDAADLAAKIEQLKSDPSLRRTLGENARREAFACHGWNRRVQQVLDAIPVSRRPADSFAYAG